MDERRPKRRRDKDNPYTQSCRDGRYYITFKGRAVGESVKNCFRYLIYKMSSKNIISRASVRDNGICEVCQCGQPNVNLRQVSA